jgi:hypothetical protein
LDSSVIIEQLGKHLNRPVSDNTAVEDTISTKPLLNKTDALGISEKIVFNMSLKERIVSSVLEQLSVNFAKSVTNITTVEDKLAFHVYLHLYDFVTSSEYIDTLLVPDVDQRCDSEMTFEEILFANFNRSVNNISNMSEHISVALSVFKADTLVSVQSIQSSVSLLKTDIVGFVEKLYLSVQRVIQETLQIQSTGRIVVQSYYAGDYYSEDFHGSSYNSIG